MCKNVQKMTKKGPKMMIFDEFSTFFQKICTIFHTPDFSVKRHPELIF
jgi:hypothetical protein